MYITTQYIPPNHILLILELPYQHIPVIYHASHTIYMLISMPELNLFGWNAQKKQNLISRT